MFSVVNRDGRQWVTVYEIKCTYGAADYKYTIFCPFRTHRSRGHVILAHMTKTIRLKATLFKNRRL